MKSRSITAKLITPFDTATDAVGFLLGTPWDDMSAKKAAATVVAHILVTSAPGLTANAQRKKLLDSFNQGLMVLFANKKVDDDGKLMTESFMETDEYQAAAAALALYETTKYPISADDRGAETRV